MKENVIYNLPEKAIDLLTQINTKPGSNLPLDAMVDLFNDLREIYGDDAEKELLEIFTLELEARRKKE